MDPIELWTWHFVVAAVLFAIAGAIAHVTRAVFNLFPDKISETPLVNVMVSRDFSWSDHLFGVEFDDAGYYRLDSLKNLRLSVLFAVTGGLGAMLVSNEVAQAVAGLIESGLGAFVDLFRQRIADLRA